MASDGWPGDRRQASTQFMHNPEGLSRNCALFDAARFWLYRTIPNHWGDPDGLGAAIHAEAQALNNESAQAAARQRS